MTDGPDAPLPDQLAAARDHVAVLRELSAAITGVLVDAEMRKGDDAANEAYIQELEADNERLANQAAAVAIQGRQFAEEVAALTVEADALRKKLRKADGELVAVRQKEVEPLNKIIVRLKSEIATMKTAMDTADANVIAYRIPGDGIPDIVVRWLGGDMWAVTDGRNRYWSPSRGWTTGHGNRDIPHSRADALKYAQALMDAAHQKKRNPS